MRRVWRGTALFGGCLILGGALLRAQIGDDPVTVSTEHPRLLLRPQRLRLLKRERQRTSPRWQQLDAFIAGKAQMPETGFAQALYYQVTGDSVNGRAAVDFALGANSDLRQQAIVFDWCQDVLSDAEKKNLAARLEKAIAAPPADDSIATNRARVFAAIALFDHVPQTPQKELERVVRKWWEGSLIPALKSGRDVIARDDAYPLMELLHAMRDNTNLDLRESFPRYFKDYPLEHLLTYYPAVFPGAEGEYFIGAEREPGEPDLRLAALSRAAELSMVGYDVNAQEIQVLQGWLMHDRFMLRGTFGAPYEFLWANPYQPGLSYFLAPLVYHNPDTGKLFVRSSWEESAKWFGYFDGVMQLFEDGKGTILNPKLIKDPIVMEQAVICMAAPTRKFTLNLEDAASVFLVGLEPRHNYLVEVDDEEMYEATADPGGILAVETPTGKEVGIRINLVPASAR